LRQDVAFNNVGLEYYFRVNFKNKKSTAGTFLDVGIYGNRAFAVQHEFTDINDKVWTKSNKIKLEYVVYMEVGIKGQYSKRDVSNTTKVMEDSLSDILGINDNKNLIVSATKAPLSKIEEAEIIHLKITNLGK